MIDGLVQRGFSEAQAQWLTANAMECVAESKIASGRKKVTLGALLVGVGLALWTMLDASPGGSVVVLFYGAIGYGAVKLFSGLTTMRFWRSRQEGIHDPAGPSSVRRRRPSA